MVDLFLLFSILQELEPATACIGAITSIKLPYVGGKKMLTCVALPEYYKISRLPLTRYARGCIIGMCLFAGS